MTLGRRLVVVQSDLLLMSEPEAAYPLRQPASDAIRDMLAYGGACILAVNAEDGPESRSIARLLVSIRAEP